MIIALSQYQKITSLNRYMYLTALEFSQSLRKHQVIPHTKKFEWEKQRQPQKKKYNIDLRPVWTERLVLNNLLSPPKDICFQQQILLES